MELTVGTGSGRKGEVLRAAIACFGRYGFRKTSMDDIAEAAGISKQGLYLHFDSKEHIFASAIDTYLEDGLELVDAALQQSGATLYERLLAAMDAWFGRHITTFTRDSFDIVEMGRRKPDRRVETYKAAFQARLTRAIVSSPEFKTSKNVCTAREIAQVLFDFGLSWKDYCPDKATFMTKVGSCIRACCQLDRKRA